jgi:hypothetical protein
VSIQEHQRIDVLHIICPHSMCVAPGLWHHVLIFYLENTQPSQYLCLMVKQEAFRYSQTMTSWHLNMVTLQEDDFLSVFKLLLMWTNGTMFGVVTELRAYWYLDFLFQRNMALLCYCPCF